MTARRSLFLMVATAIIFLLAALYLALRLQGVVRVTNDLINTYAALDRWQMAAVESPIDVSVIRESAATIRQYIPGQIGEANTPAVDYLYFLNQDIPDDTARQNALELKEILVWELFECHRLQNMYSGLVNLTQIALTIVILTIGIISFFMGRRAQDYRLAPFPEANPNPVFGLNYQGRLIYTNQAVATTLAHYVGGTSSELTLLPDNFSERIAALKQRKQFKDVWIHPVKDHIFEHRVHLLPKLDRIHIYSENITEQEEIRARNAFIAYHDPVCLLANRQRLEQLVDQQRYPEQPLTLVMSFVSGLSRVLSTQGLGVADQFAREFSIRLRAAFQSLVFDAAHTPVVFRFDTNLFGCLYYAQLSKKQHAQLEKALQLSVEQPFIHEKREFFFSLQSGASSEPSSVSSRQLIQQVNLALHAIAGKDQRYQVYGDDIEARIQAITKVEQALHHAVELDELAMVYQPQQDLKSGRLIGFEALMRWHHQGKVISPADFIPIAENTGLIHSLGHWALRDVMKQRIDWLSMADIQPGVVAVNVSAQEFARRDFIEGVEVALADYPVDPSLIQLEITESLLIDDEKIAIERMHCLKELGFTLAIDDFGTGYSSFSYLSTFPVDKLKIDRSFIVNMKNGQRDVALVAAMVDVAQQLGIKVIAEGVETEQEREQLMQLGCDQIQGYLYGKPMTVAQATLFATRGVEVL